MTGIYGELLRGSLNPLNLVKSVRYKYLFRREHPDYFDPDGIIAFSGPQGSGKTLSAVRYVRRMAERYPSMILVTNILVRGLPNSVIVYPYEGWESLSKYNNGYAGVCYLIDEIHLEFNSLESKNIPVAVFTEVAQQRKQRKCIVGTTQVFTRLAKPFREQFRWLVACHNLFGLIQYNQLIDGVTATVDSDGHMTAKVAHTYLHLHSPDDYNAYDTYAKINRFQPQNLPGVVTQ